MKKLIIAMLLSPSLFAEEARQNYHVVSIKAIALVKYDWPTLLADWALSFLPSRPGILGEADPRHHAINIWIRDDESPKRVAEIIVHELAHKVDLMHLSPEQRAEWRKLRGIDPEVLWIHPSGKGKKVSDSDTSSGDFAECVVWTIQGPSSTFSSRLGPPPSKVQQQVIRKWLAEIKTAGN